MEMLKKALPALVSGVLLAGAFLATPPVTVQGEVPKDTRIVNTVAEPVPTTMVGTASIQGSITAQQGGAWNVGIVGTPIFGIDPNQNSVRLSGGGTKLLLNTSFEQLPADTDTQIDSIDISPYAKVRVSGTVNGSGDITYRIYSGPVVGGPHTGLKSLDSFTSGSTWTRVYEVAGLALHISIHPESSNNQSIITVYGH